MLSSAVFCQETGTPTALQRKLAADELLRGGDTAQAITEYQKALALDPSFKALYFNLAVAYHIRRDFKEAIGTLEKLVALDPQDVEAHYNLGVLYLYERNLEQAKTHLEKAKLCCERDPAFQPLVEQSSAFINHVEKLDPTARELILLLMRRDLEV
ncbi:MAG: tetratricopeptide repeat protein [Candidatus Omnitrophota bacterium]